MAPSEISRKFASDFANSRAFSRVGKGLPIELFHPRRIIAASRFSINSQVRDERDVKPIPDDVSLRRDALLRLPKLGRVFDLAARNMTRTDHDVQELMFQDMFNHFTRRVGAV